MHLYTTKHFLHLQNGESILYLFRIALELKIAQGHISTWCESQHLKQYKTSNLYK